MTRIRIYKDYGIIVNTLDSWLASRKGENARLRMDGFCVVERNWIQGTGHEAWHHQKIFTIENLSTWHGQWFLSTPTSKYIWWAYKWSGHGGTYRNSIQAIITKYRKLGDYKQKFIAHCSRAWKSEIRVPTRTTESSLLGHRLLIVFSQGKLTFWSLIYKGTIPIHGISTLII